MAEVLAARPEAGSPAATKQVEFLVATEKTAEEVSAKCQIPTIVASVKAELLPGEVATTGRPSKRVSKDIGEESPITSAAHIAEQPDEFETHESTSDAGGQLHTTLAENILRVDAERIDSVLNLVGELIIGKSMLQQALNELTKLYPKDALRGRLADAIAFQARVLNDLQRSVMKIRMVPVDQLFRRFPRVVRDVARQCGKEIELVVKGDIRPEYPEDEDLPGLSPALWKLAEMCWTTNPMQRPTAVGVCDTLSVLRQSLPRAAAPRRSRRSGRRAAPDRPTRWCRSRAGAASPPSGRG
jgi:hypothetical protein